MSTKKKNRLFAGIAIGVLLLMVGIGFMQAAELKIWGRAGNDEIISLRGNRPFIRCSDASNKTAKFVVDSAGNVNISGNIIASGTITPNAGLGTSSIATLAVAGTSSLTGAVSARSTLNVSGATTVNTTLTVGGVSTFSQAVNVNGAATVSGAVLGVTTVRAGTSLQVGTTSAFSGLITASGGATVSGAALTAQATAPVSAVTLTVSGSQRWVRTELAASSASTSTATVADIQGGWITLGEFQNLTLPTAATATCAGLDIFISGASCGTAWVIIPLGDGGAGAGRDTVELNSYETLNLYCDGAQFWVRHTNGTID